MGRSTILVAIKRASMFRVIEHLFRNNRRFMVIPFAGTEASLTTHVFRTSPDFIILSPEFLVENSLPELRQRNRAARIILIHSWLEIEKPINIEGIDACVGDETLVEDLPSTIKRLLTLEHPKVASITSGQKEMK